VRPRPAVLTNDNLAIARAALLAAGKMKRLISHFKMGNASNYRKFYRRSKFEKMNGTFAGNDKKAIRLLQLIYEKWLHFNVRRGCVGSSEAVRRCCTYLVPARFQRSQAGSRRSSSWLCSASVPR
jgi:hypothetical protein